MKWHKHSVYTFQLIRLFQQFSLFSRFNTSEAKMHKPCLMSQHLPRATKVWLVGGLRVRCCVFFSRYACVCVESTSVRTDSGKKKTKTAMVLESTIPTLFMEKPVLPDRFVRSQAPLSGHSGFPWGGSRVARLGSLLLQHVAKIVTPLSWHPSGMRLLPHAGLITPPLSPSH